MRRIGVLVVGLLVLGTVPASAGQPASGAGVKIVQRQLGHRTATMTLDRYAHLFPDELDALSGALDGLRTRTPTDSSRTLELWGRSMSTAHSL